MNTGILKKLDGIAMLEDESFRQEGEFLVRELTLDDIDLVGVFLFQTSEDCLEHAVDSLHRLVVVLLESHLEIESHELGQVTVSVGILGSEN